MDPRTRQEVANFRYGLIAPVVARQGLTRGEQTRLLQQAAAGSYQVPGSSRTRVSTRTLERYLAAYRRHGLAGLLPRERQGSRRICPQSLELAAQLRRENPDRSIERILTMLYVAS